MRTVASGAKRIVFFVATFFIYTHVRIQRRGTPPPPEKSPNIGFLSNSSPDPLKKYEATEPAFNVVPLSARQRNAIYADDGPLIVIFRSTHPSSTKKTSGSAHVLCVC